MQSVKWKKSLKIGVLLILLVVIGAVLYFQFVQKTTHKSISKEDVSGIQVSGIDGTKDIQDQESIDNIINWFNKVDNIRQNKEFAGTTSESSIIINLKSMKTILILNSGSDFEIQRNDVKLDYISYWGRQKDLKEYLEKLTNKEKKETLKESDKKASNTDPITGLDVTKVEWITKKGGRMQSTWSLLFPERDDEKIRKIINLIKSGNVKKSTGEDLDFVQKRLGYPVDIVIKLKDESMFTLITAMKLTTKVTDEGTETTGTKYKDRFIIQYEKDGNKEYYTVYSEDATEYVSEGSNTDFSTVKVFSVNPDNFKFGENISVSGDGCTEKEVNIVFVTIKGEERKEYIIGKVKPVFGEWKWSGSIDVDTKTYDGKDIPMDAESFVVCAQYGVNNYGTDAKEIN